MAKYYLPLSKQEELALQQLATQPGYEVIFKLLQMEALDAQAAAMDCVSAKPDERLLALSDAQVTQRVASRLINKLAGYQPQLVAPAEEIGEFIPDAWTRETH